MALIVWCTTTDRLGRRMYVCVGQTIVVFCCFIVGSLWYANASNAANPNASASTALVSGLPPPLCL